MGQTELEITLSLLSLSLILTFMEFPWATIGVILSGVTLSVLLSYNIPKLVKYVCAPKITISLYVYSQKDGTQQGVIQNSEHKIYNKQIEVLPNISPQLAILIKPHWKYTVDSIEVVGHSKSRITRIDHFAENRFWLEKGYSDVGGNYKVFPEITIRKSGTSDALILDLQIVPPFSKGEERKITVNISVNESRKPLSKDFLVRASE